MKKLIFLPFIILSLIVGFYAGFEYQKKQAVISISPLDQAGIQTVNFMLDYGNGQIKSYNQIKLDAEATVFSVLEALSKSENFELKYKDYGGEMGAFVEAIGGVSNNFNDNVYWQYWVNGEYSKVGAGARKLVGGEVVEWKFVKGQVD